MAIRWLVPHNGSIVLGVCPPYAAFVLALVGGLLLAMGTYVGGAVCVVFAILVHWLYRIGVGRGEYG